MDEIDKILLRLGYGNSDPFKKQEIEGYVNEAVEYMLSKGIAEDKIKTQTAFVIKSLWADYRDKGEDESITKKDGMIIHLIIDLRRR